MADEPTQAGPGIAKEFVNGIRNGANRVEEKVEAPINAARGWGRDVGEALREGVKIGLTGLFAGAVGAGAGYAFAKVTGK